MVGCGRQGVKIKTIQANSMGMSSPLLTVPCSIMSLVNTNFSCTAQKGTEGIYACPS